MKKTNVRALYFVCVSDAVGRVIDVKNRYAQTWRGLPESYWLARLVSECSDLHLVVVRHGWDSVSVDAALQTIASTALNWLEMRQVDKTPEEKRLRKFRGTMKGRPSLWWRIKRWWETQTK